jgi:hypothetical protein
LILRGLCAWDRSVWLIAGELVSQLVVPSRLFALDIRKRTRVEKKVSVAERPVLSNRDITTIVSKQP